MKKESFISIIFPSIGLVSACVLLIALLIDNNKAYPLIVVGVLCIVGNGVSLYSRIFGNKKL